MDDTLWNCRVLELTCWWRLCAGHSLGGAVAVLATLRLLRQLPRDAQPALRCNVFACPAIGNAALALYVKEMGWEHYFNNLLVPGLRLLLLSAADYIMQNVLPFVLRSSQDHDKVLEPLLVGRPCSDGCLLVAAEDAVPRLLGGTQQQSMPAADMFNTTVVTQSRLASARSMLSRKLSFSRAAEPVAASATAATVGSAAAIARGRRKSTTATGANEGISAQRRSGTGLDCWKNGPEGASFGTAGEDDVLSLGVRRDAGSEWDVVSASLDESGGGQDFEAGLGVRPELAARDQPGSETARARRRRLRYKSRADDYDRSLTPIWPLSLYPLSYRANLSVEQPQQSMNVSSNSSGDRQQPSAASVSVAAASQISASAAMADRVKGTGAGHKPTAALPSRSVPDEDDNAAAALGMQSSLLGLVPLDAGESSTQQEQRSSASTSTLARRPEAADEVQKQRKQSSGALGRASNNAVPAQPMSRFTAVRQTAARAGRVVLGASAFGARVCC